MLENKIMESLVEDVKLMKEALKQNSHQAISNLSEQEINESVDGLNDEMSIDEVEDDEIDAQDVTVDDEESGEAEGSETESGETEDSEEAEAGDMDIEDLDGSEDIDLDLGDDSEIDLTSATDDEVLTVYKQLTDTDEIEFIDNGDSLELDVKEPGKFIVKDETKDSEEITDLGDMEDSLSDSEDGGEDITMSDLGDEEEEIEYEIDEADLQEALDEMYSEDNDSEEAVNEEDEKEVDSEEPVEEEVVDEKMSKAMPDVHQQQVRPDSVETKGRGLNESVITESVYNDLKERYNNMVEKNKEISGVVTELKSLLHEAMLANANLSYFTQIVTENATTKAEKKTILEKFDAVKTVSESKELFLTISKEMKSSNKAKENKINESTISNVGTGYSGTIKENVSFVDPNLGKMINIMDQMDNLRK